MQRRGLVCTLGVGGRGDLLFQESGLIFSLHLALSIYIKVMCAHHKRYISILCV